ncbi:fungal-specific transcription factor domain-containing protein [Aspergillus alliaceus]|uniref:Fungal-specific transcription factor domain-containing protein n=1 Tax=Petromyces alliaceus TaxID=209559 RepID=A0A5N7CJW3_PETAA|nr:fungal-specific transcription factor domain-containing protein [Aspergillus alliaceus]
MPMCRCRYPRKKALRQSATSTHQEDSTIADSIISADHSTFQPDDSSSVHIDASTSPDQRFHLGHRSNAANHPGISFGPPWISPGDTASISQQTVFLGESSPLTCVIDEGRRSPEKGPSNVMRKTRLHYPIPERLDANSTRDDALRVHKTKIGEQLNADGAFSYPPKETCEILLSAYFTWFHPCFPILDRSAVNQSYTRGDISRLLLQSMLFIGVSLCTDEDFARTEFSVRYRAKFHFYSKAKAIYDADWESNKTTKLQSLFLLSSWRGGPSEERDTRFWLGVAISLAQKRGMHMMSKLSFQSTREEKLWKRIWWALYVRDQQSAAALGLPPRIRDEDCDVAMLVPSDIREGETVDDVCVFGVQKDEDVVYPTEMVKLARIQSAASAGAIFLTGLLHMTYKITHTFSTLCIHTIHCRRTSGTARKLAEHRAKLCLLGLQELQKTWDLENWVLDLFFRCLDDGTARTLRLTDIVTPPGQPMSQAESVNKDIDTNYTRDLPTPVETMDPIHNDPTLAPSLQTSPNMEHGDIAAPGDWYGLFNFTDDFTDVLGASYHDPRNLQNLQFLYRFL